MTIDRPSAGRPPARNPRRLRWWMIVGIVVACVLAITVVAIGTHEAVRTMDTYTADLTKGFGDFRSRDNPDVAAFYRSDGYHLVVKTPGSVISGVNAPSSHTMIAAKVTVRGVTVPTGAAFGPFVLMNATGPGYSLTVDTAGTATLVEIYGNGDARTITSARAPALTAGTTRELMLTCAIPLSGRVRLAGYVDGVRVISGTPQNDIPSVSSTGMAGWATNVPAEWVATRFARLGPDDMPPGATNQR